MSSLKSLRRFKTQSLNVCLTYKLTVKVIRFRSCITMKCQMVAACHQRHMEPVFCLFVFCCFCSLFGSSLVVFIFFFFFLGGGGGGGAWVVVVYDFCFCFVFVCVCVCVCFFGGGDRRGVPHTFLPASSPALKTSLISRGRGRGKGARALFSYPLARNFIFFYSSIRVGVHEILQVNTPDKF